jgi:hypothetical protein
VTHMRLIVNKPSLENQTVLLPWPKAQKVVHKTVRDRKKLSSRIKRVYVDLLDWWKESKEALALLALAGIGVLLLLVAGK